VQSLNRPVQIVNRGILSNIHLGWGLDYEAPLKNLGENLQMEFISEFSLFDVICVGVACYVLGVLSCIILAYSVFKN